ncbi:hypothetical protein SERLADRAFT_457339 [Serpula lacrymans var. lacrymans S7.9]|nr:uncharacterized protein SERLADRAFT_457339 [Serpula lacrymans var. lacrymans S7.9]EGO29511.1 hypothetical protein SERLADRAFT_457339 [Serpula lacrymans var. lacrymans S7.9]
MIPNQQDRVSWLSLEADKLVNEVRTVREELFATQKQCTAAESQYEELQKKHRVVENDLKEMTTKAEDLDRTVTEAAFLCISQGEELDELKQRCAGLEEKTGRCSCRIAGLDVVNEGAGVNAPLCSPVTEDGVFNTTRPKTLGLQDVMEWSMSASPAYLDISSILSDIADEGSAAVTCSLALESQFAFQIAVDSPLGRLRSGTTPADCRGATWAPSGRRIVQHSRAPFPIPALRPAWPIEYRDPRSEEYGKARVTKRRRTVQVAGQPEGKEEDDVGEKVSWVHRTRARRARSVRRL